MAKALRTSGSTPTARLPGARPTALRVADQPAALPEGPNESALTDELELRIHDVMVEARLTEETLIRMMRSGHGYFWIGAPGEEAFGAALGLQVRKGRGPDFDFLHLHYRASPTVLAMGAPPIDLLRQMRSTRTDPYSGGRNFVGHFSIPEWNIVPGTSTIETQYAIAPGTAWIQRRHGGQGITVVTGGDAGTSEGDFTTCLNWASRPGAELPILILIHHNGFGISTPAGQVHNTLALHERAAPYGIRNARVDGNDPVAAWGALAEAMAYVRTERKPFCLQADVSRLYGHSSSSGARHEPGRDCIAEYEHSLADRGLLSPEEAARVHEKWKAYLREAVRKVMAEPMPAGEDAFRHVFHEPDDQRA